MLVLTLPPNEAIILHDQATGIVLATIKATSNEDKSTRVAIEAQPQILIRRERLPLSNVMAFRERAQRDQ
jgi:sRNA-binding carbon storage regulator CsrA